MDAFTTPSNWQRVKLGDIATFLKGKGLSKNQVSPNAKHECILYGELFTHYDRVVINIKSFTNIYDNPILSLNNDVLMSGSAETPDILATASCILKKGVILGGDILIIRPNSNLLSGCFLAYCIVCDKNQVLSKVVGSTVYHLYAKDLKDFEILLPPLNEQIAIANILSALDRYLYSLDALILKKESVKKALSFELLSQRKRLKGFNQAWQRVRLGDVANYLTSNLSAEQITQQGKIKVYDVNNFIGYTNTTFISDKPYISIVKDGSVGRVRILPPKTNILSTMGALIANHKTTTEFLFYLLSNFDFKNFTSGSIIPHIYFKDYKEKTIFLPPLNEQIAIANILSTLDSEIASLKNKKRQFENIKKALNHDLMSAKIRVLNK
ncbi:restriction endonuclease subunit S [Helicobacter pylori]|uniref:restriction endonuclease subunit S n=1 Tax=Helicobacter pylori TaxID=210 RepID=UPI000EB153F5|nr:restriction endonuclease subunit S [Helicobacter pylori]RKV48579.1 restriction endonuclease subunit S [Helicobacter pylori]